ncbi:hypothetical protein BABINDRAFT_7725 [Babjeviella inositovora NRRL Y-12698]|uniref:Uncharacterized protein n=1 Tax=Babjeviella inositovora NRRL Y-12698 TaxID=984486 RepID=A0A1E3QRG7_9ASCO|nr:uncharacterized protein BABINDRAFT_7725 [Babjeviella inositovora NRRL Y-12698]ODQ80271.1 hypothetical protein BABINDRAFT_7725 [Babjeviella inositovora NRRL Y-12698]
MVQTHIFHPRYLDVVNNALVFDYPYGNASCQVMVLPYGSLQLDAHTNITLHLPAFYLYNCTSYSEEVINYYYKLGQELLQQYAFLTTVDVSWGGVDALCYALSSVAIIAWLLIILMLISSQVVKTKTKNDYVYNEYAQNFARGQARDRDYRGNYQHSKSAFTNKTRTRRLMQFCVLFFTALFTAVFVKVTVNVEASYMAGYQDVKEFHLEILSSVWFSVLRDVLFQLFINLAWLSLLLGLIRPRYRRLFFGIALTYCLVLTVLGCVTILTEMKNNSFKRNYTKSESTSKIKLASIVLREIYFVATRVFFLGYTIHKRKYAYVKATFFLAFISILFFIIAFILSVLGTECMWFRTWSIMWVPLMKVLGLYTVDVWLTRIDYLVRKEESAGVLGRKTNHLDLESPSQPPSNRRGAGSRTSGTINNLSLPHPTGLFTKLNAFIISFGSHGSEGMGRDEEILRTPSSYPVDPPIHLDSIVSTNNAMHEHYGLPLRSENLEDGLPYIPSESPNSEVFEVYIH